MVVGSTMRQTSISFSSGTITLEGVFASPEDTSISYPGVVVCHPHPQMGGDMDNNLVMAVVRSLVDSGIAALRFNFRGVGESEGSFDQGNSEKDDVDSALGVLGNLPGVVKRRLGLAGYSFGAVVSMTGLSKYRGVKALALISPPLRAFDGLGEVKGNIPKLIVSGDKDQVVPHASLEETLASKGRWADLRMIPGADHSWWGYETIAGEEVSRFFVTHLLK